MAKNRKTTWVVLFLVALLLFIIFVLIESNMANRYERKPAVIATMEVPKNLQLTKKNIGKYFEIKNVDASLFTDNTVTRLGDMEGLYVQEVVHAKEILSKKSLVDTADLTADLVNPVKVSFSVSAIQNAAAGRIRTGEKINLYAYDDAMKNVNKIFDGLYVETAYDSEGNEISSSDSNSIAVTFTVLIQGQDEEYFYNSITGNELYISVSAVDDILTKDMSGEENTISFSSISEGAVDTIKKN